MGKEEKEPTKLEILEGMAAALEGGTQEAITKAYHTTLAYISRFGEDKLAASFMILVHAVKDDALRRKAYRIAIDWTRNTEKEVKKAVDLFVAECQRIKDPEQRFAAFIDMEDARYRQKAFMDQVVPPCLALAEGMKTPEARVGAYEKLDEFCRYSEWRGPAAEGIMKHAPVLPAAERVKVYGHIAYADIRKDLRRERGIYRKAARACLDAIAELPIGERALEYVHILRYSLLTADQQRKAMKGFLSDIGIVGDNEKCREYCSDMLRAVKEGGPDRKMLHDFIDEKKEIVEVMISRASRLRDFEKRNTAYYTAAEHSPNNSTADIVLADMFTKDVQKMKARAARLTAYEEMAMNIHYTAAGGHLHQVALNGWQAEIAAMPPQDRLKHLHGAMFKFFAVHKDGFNEAMLAIHDKAVADLPDAKARIRACVSTINACWNFAAHPLEKVAMEGFKKHLNEFSELERAQICWNLMDHDREQSMLPDPPFDQLLHAEWMKCRPAEEKKRASAEDAVMARIKKQGKRAPAQG